MSERELDHGLVKRVQSGDKMAFDLLVRKYQGKVIGLVSRLIRDPMAVEDVAQESFIKAYRGLATFRGDSAFYTWLYRITVNAAKNHLVSKARKAHEGSIDAQEAEQYESSELLREYDTPEGVAETEEVRVAVIRAIECLPEELKMAISLREFDGLSYEGIAEVMECPIGTVRSRIFRAREAIEKSIASLAYQQY